MILRTHDKIEAHRINAFYNCVVYNVLLKSLEIDFDLYDHSSYVSAISHSILFILTCFTDKSALIADTAQ
jgi:hypothetical protein